MDLQVLWFILVVVLFCGFFFLEGFDYGVGTILPFFTEDDTERRMLINTIGPVWDGNEVWMLTAGGAMFAAFPHVYATMFSTFYLALFLMLIGLIVRGVSFEFRSKHDCEGWRSAWDALICIGSILPAFLWGVAVTNLMQGFAIDENMIYQGTFFDLLSPYTIVGGLAFLMIFAYHGTAFLTLRLGDESMVNRLRPFGLKIGVVAAALFVVWLALTISNTDMWNSTLSAALMVATAVVFIGSMLLMRQKSGKAFAASSLAIVFTTVAVFAGLFPRLLISTLNPEWNLTIYNASSTDYTLTIMSVAALFFVPLVLIYQGWTYWIFRKRITAKDLKY